MMEAADVFPLIRETKLELFANPMFWDARLTHQYLVVQTIKVLLSVGHAHQMTALYSSNG